MKHVMKIVCIFMMFLWTGCLSKEYLSKSDASIVFVDFIDYNDNRVADYAFVVMKQDIVDFVNKKRNQPELSRADFSLIYKMKDRNDSLYLKSPIDNVSDQELDNWLSVSDHIVIPFLHSHKIFIYDKKNHKMEHRYKIKRIKGLYGNSYLQCVLPDGRKFYEIQNAFGE